MQFILIVQQHHPAIDFYELYPGTALKSYDYNNNTYIQSIYFTQYTYIHHVLRIVLGIITSDVYVINKR